MPAHSERAVADSRKPALSQRPAGPDALSWDSSGVFVAEALLHHGQITGTYLLALAVHHQGRLVSFDSRLSSKAVCGGSQALQLIDLG